MASAKKCDRCGGYYDVMGEDGRAQINNNYLYFLKMFNTENFIIDNIDLCPACTNSFYDWLYYNTLETDAEIPEINHINCPYRKDVVCAPNDDGNHNCVICDVYKQTFGNESSFVVCPYLKNDTNGLACAHTKTCKGPCELVLTINEESKKEDEECSKEENTSST